MWQFIYLFIFIYFIYFERFQYFCFEADFLEHKEYFHKTVVPLFSWKH